MGTRRLLSFYVVLVILILLISQFLASKQVHQNKFGSRDNVIIIPLPSSITVSRRNIFYTLNSTMQDFQSVLSVLKHRFPSTLTVQKETMNEKEYEKAAAAQDLIELKYSNTITIAVYSSDNKEQVFNADKLLFPITGRGKNLVFLSAKDSTFISLGPLSNYGTSQLTSIFDKYAWYYPERELNANLVTTSRNIVGDQITNDELKKLKIIKKQSIKINQYGKKGTVYFAGTPVKQTGSDQNNGLFFNHTYFVYKNNITKRLEKLEIDCQNHYLNIDLFEDMLQIKFADLDGDKVQEIIYLYRFPYPEPVAWNPVVLKYNQETGGFKEIRIDENEYRIEQWNVIKKESTSESRLQVQLYSDFAPKPYVRYLKLVGDKLVEER